MKERTPEEIEKYHEERLKNAEKGAERRREKKEAKIEMAGKSPEERRKIKEKIAKKNNAEEL